MRLSLGTANFGIKYGFLNKKIKRKDLKKIKSFCIKKKILHIDTSTDYKNSFKFLNKIIDKKFKVIIKIKFKNKKLNDYKSFKKHILFIKNKLNIKSFYGLLIHEPKDLIGKKGLKRINFFKKIQKQELVKKIGISIYSYLDLKRIERFLEPEIVQFPLNVFDDRITKTKWFRDVKKNPKVETYARSCFLQGSLINFKRSNKKVITRFRGDFDNFHKWCEKKNLSPMDACIHFVKKYRYIDYLIIGFDDIHQLIYINNSFKKKNIKIPNIFCKNKIKLVDPRLW